MAFQSTLLVIFGIIAYMMWVDENVTIFINLMVKWVRVNIERLFWMIRLHPRNPITNYLKKREYNKIAEELMREYEKD
jgi:hypothetical protein